MNRNPVIALLFLVGACADEPTVPPPAAPPPLTGAEVLEVAGTVETRHAGAWSSAQIGQRLSANDAIRTSDGGRATIGVGNDAKVRLDDRSEVSVREISRAVAKVRLERGRMGADVRSKDLVLEVHAAGSSAVTKANDAKFSVFNDGKGVVAVAARRGEVKLKTERGETKLTEGKQARLIDDGAPEVDDIPASVFLKVAWPKKKRSRRESTQIAGRVDPGTTVTVNGAIATVEKDGAFRVNVPLEEGKNPIRVAAVDLTGRKASDEATMRRRKPRSLSVTAPKRISRWE